MEVPRPRKTDRGAASALMLRSTRFHAPLAKEEDKWPRFKFGTPEPARLRPRPQQTRRRWRAAPASPTYRVTWWQDGKLRHEPVGKNRRRAEAALRKIASRLDDGVYLAPENISFETWAERWLASLRRPKQTTVTSYKPSIDYATSVFGSKAVRKLNIDDVLAFLHVMKESEISASTQAKHLRVLGACLKAAVRHGHAPQNPIDRLDPALKPRPERREAAWFEDDELPRLFAEVPEGLFRVLFEVALKTGARQGELVAARWSDINLTDAVFRVRRTYSGGELGTPKTFAGRRDIHLGSDTVALLGRWWGELGKPSDDSVVFPGESNAHLQNWTILNRELYPAMERAGISRQHPKTGNKRVFHSFRHSFARIALENDRSLPWLQRHLGHSSLAVTVGIYGHFADQAA